ncbi:cell division protein FtsL [Clostridium sp. LP20]|uniref:cell division protein FtsL n=1 Tax=Clostridium sp. LP20 TaxID=3418665 RepID=UPI003EE77039
MVVKDYDYIKGNTAAKPQRRSNESDRRKYEELKRSKKDRNKRLREDQNKKRKGILQIALLIFILGVTTISRDAKVYTMQKEVKKINADIKTVNDENEALRVELLKVASLENIRTNAEEKLGMAVVTKENVVQIDLSENYFAELETESTKGNKEEKSLFSKLMDALD